MNLKETLDWYVKEGYLVAVPDGCLTLYDYTNQCALKGNWNYHTRLARGAVLDETGKIVSQPFPKFFNLYEREETYLQNLPKEEPEIAEKLDGSLVIVFRHPLTGRWCATTRRSWRNVQTQFAYKWLEVNGEKLQDGFTYCFEAIGSWNKIVVEYAEDKMILTGRIDQYGNDSSYADLQSFAEETGLESVNFRVGRLDALEPEEFRANFEGYVARYSNGVRVKLKGEWYLEQHALMAKQTAGKFCQPLD